MKLLTTMVMTAAAFAAVSDAATISVARGIGNPGLTVANSSGTALSGGYYIAVGTFTEGGATAEPVVTDFASLLSAVASFDVFASGSSPTSGATAGTVSGSFTSTGGAAADVFNLKAIYILIGNGSSLDTSTEFAILKSTSGTAFPADVAAAGSTTFSTANAAAVTLIAGSVGENNIISLMPTVPEPSVAILGAFGLLGLARRRR